MRRMIETYNDSSTKENNFYDSLIIANFLKCGITILHYRIKRKWVSFYDVNCRRITNKY